MRRCVGSLCALVVILTWSGIARATIFSNVRGIVHDPEHRPVGKAKIVLKAQYSDWRATTETNSEGEFSSGAVPLGDYTLTISAAGFRVAETALRISSGNSPILHFSLDLATLKESVQVNERAPVVDMESSAEPITVSRIDIAQTPGADQSNSLAMLTDFVPGAYLTHDELHFRGGHQVMWLVDGVPVPNINVISNVAPQFDPKDVNYVEIQRGGYSAEYGDRAYGVFNVVPRSGFERNNQAELLTSYGNFRTTNDQLSLGSHTERFAYYMSVNSNRSDLGLETPAPQVVHDLESGLGGFASLFYNATPSDQLRVVTSLRSDHYQVPNSPQQQSAGIRDLDLERDAFTNFTWVHNAGAGMLLRVSPFYHFNSAHYLGGPGDIPVIPDESTASNYLGGQGSLGVVRGKHNARAGFEVFGDHENSLFGIQSTDGSLPALHQSLSTWGNLEAGYLEDQYKLDRWFTLNAGVRLTRFSGSLSETAASPRVGGALQVPKLGVILRAFYGRYYQPPPLSTISGPVLDLVLTQGFGFLPLHGERDEQHEFGLTIPVRGWTLDAANFRTAANNYFDHNVLGNSNIFFPVTLERARIRGWEGTVRSPQLLRRMNYHLAYSRMFVQGQGGETGGLTDFEPPENANYYSLDDDQRQGISTGLTVELPWRAWASTNVAYGSGFLNGEGPAHLPAHTTTDLQLGKSLGESWSVQLCGLNIGNRRFLLDNEYTFGGTHFINPRQIGLEVRYRFRY